MQQRSKDLYQDACALAWRYRTDKGMSYTAIAAHLATAKWQTRLGGKWRPRAVKAAIAAHEKTQGKAVGGVKTAPEPIAEPKPSLEAAAEPVPEQEPGTLPAYHDACVTPPGPQPLAQRGANLPCPLSTPDAEPATIDDPVGIGDPAVWDKLPGHLRQAVVDELLKWLSKGGVA